MNRLAHSSDDDESVLDKQGLASVTLSVNWSDDLDAHEAQLYVEKFSAWREADRLPPDIGLNIPRLRAGVEAQALLQPGEMISSWESSRVISADPAHFDRNHRADLDSSVSHQPVATKGEPCICLIATDLPLRFSGIVSRMLQPLIGI